MHRYLILLALLSLSRFTSAQPPDTLPAIGVAGELAQDSLLAAAGFARLVESTQRLLSPRQVTEAEFAETAAHAARLPAPLYGCNLFLPGELRVTGPAVDEAAVLGYVDTVLRRAQVLGLSIITWGSCGSRRLEGDFSPITATAQFVRAARLVAEAAARYDVTLVLENLNSTECNFITSVPEALAVVKAVEHPNFRLCVDIYHMLVDRQPATDIRGVGEYAVYSELAERRDRAAPGVHGEDFGPYLRALHAEGYTGPFVLECRWNDLAAEAPTAYGELRRQVAEVFN